MLKNCIIQISFSLLIGAGTSNVFAQTGSKTFWTKQSTAVRSSARTWYPKSYQGFSLDVDGLKAFLASAPMQKSAADHSSEFIVELPMPDESFQHFHLVESPIMEPALAAKFPEIKTYAGQGIDDKTATIRCDITPHGFHGFILSANGTIYIDPVSLNDTRNYIVYYKREIPAEQFSLQCGVEDHAAFDKNNVHATNSLAVLDGQLRTYRLALAANHWYVQFFGGSGPAFIEMTTAINRVTEVYEQELDITFVFANNEDQIIYSTAASDPYGNSVDNSLLSTNRNNINSVIGYANYDIGHVFTTGGGGLANVGCVCDSTKAYGATGLSNPTGDGFYIDYVCHEMGHQFGAQHTFNAETGGCGNNNRAIAYAYEPGSGSTIMAYAGICLANDLQPHTDAYFHTVSFDQIVLYSQSLQGNSCPSYTPGGNQAPTIAIPPSNTIPINTAFRLSASASDPDGEAVTYCWEEYDLSGFTSSGQSWDVQIPGVNAPIFRSFSPTASPERIFPKWTSIVNDTTEIGEVLPIYARQLHFRCTARDNHSGCGGVTHSAGSAIVNVVNMNGLGFAVTNPSKQGVEWDKRKEHTVFWEVAGSDASPINTPYVNMYLSTDGGYTFNDTLAMHLPNTGSYTFSLPSWIVNTPDTAYWDKARILIEGEGNIFFDMSNHNFRIDTLDILEPLDSSFIVKFVNLGIVTNSITFKLMAPMNGGFTISIYDAVGKLNKKITLEKNSQLVEKTIEVSDLASGMYVIRFDGPDYSFKQKFVKAKSK